jgi:Xaa-Pro aminopeptidase
MDGVAVTKFMIWLKDEIKTREISELEADEKITSFRYEWKDIITKSFGTIAGYGPNGASMHYSATKDSYSMCKAKDFLLVDSGGTYKQGTTDITRTFLLGDTSHAFKEDYTMVLRSHVILNKAKFLYGSSGPTLDGLCRQPFWERGLDYKHGTGHGVGHVLNVHEGPNNFFWNPSRGLCVFEEGMITTNEPGYYVEGSHGIRIENELLCVKAEKNEYGQFMKFESLTICPYDLDAVLVDQLTKSEKEWINSYHKECYEKLSPYLNEYEKEKLKEYTREI